jgi:hypothetical protein
MAATVAVRHTVEDFDTWRIAFDEHVTIRTKHACTGERVLQADGDPNQVLVLTTWPSLKEAHAFAEDPSLPGAMKQANVVGAPRIEFYDGAAF